ncbi:MAG: prolyl oligopeptidase family serine peptidase [Firmicutes bacterium]|nr:prolyl oligopeptidase family serine peptidase [Bacillota bacterium]
MTMQELEKYYENWWIYDFKDQLKRFIYKRSDEAFAQGDIFRDAIKTREELEKRAAYMREKFIESIGGLPPGDTPLNPRITGIIDCDGFRIEKVFFESRPGTYVTANLYIPDGITSPRGAVLFLCGHHKQAKHTDEYQVVCRYLVRAGLVVLAQDPIGQGERLSYYDKATGKTNVDWGVIEHDYAGCQCWPLGDGIARYFVHDAMRGIDYLCTRPEVDPSKIGVTGNSGGGTQTALMMMCDPRIAAAAPATFLMNRQTYMYTDMPQDSEQIWPGLTARGFDHEDILISMVPKPVLVLAVTSDFFPIEGTRRTVERTRRFWEMYGKKDNLKLFEDDSDHRYTRPMAKAAAEFFSEHLLGQKISPDDESINPIEPSILWCTISGQVKGDMDNARTVYDENCDRLKEIEKQRNSMPENKRREIALNWLKEKIYSGRKPCDLNPRRFAVGQVDGLDVQICLWWSQEGIFNCAYLFRNFNFAGKELPLTIAIWDDGTNCLVPHADWIQKTCASGRIVMVLDTSGVGIMSQRQITYAPVQEVLGSIFKLTYDLLWLDDSMAALRTYDVIRAMDAVKVIPGINEDDINLYLSGRHGVYGLFAAVLDKTMLDKRIKNIEVANGIVSFGEWVRSRYYDTHDIMSIVLPGMLKYFDLPDLEKWFYEKAE